MSEPIRAKHYDVFVSYKREDDAAREVLVAALEKEGYEVFWDAKLRIDFWRPELREEIQNSKLVIVLWSAKAAASEEVKVEAGGALQLKKLMSAPIEAASVIPKPYRDTNLHAFHDWADTAKRAPQLAKILATVRRVIGRSGPPEDVVVKQTIPVELGELPAAPPRLIGRDNEMKMLREAWRGGTVNAVVLHALGGAGKSALLRAFVNERLAEGGDGAARIYGWSAYSMGSSEQRRVDADAFITRALADFGYDGPALKDPTARGRALSRLIQKERVLLLLDGLEPLQDPPGVNKGRFRDKGLAALIKALGNMNPGLLVLTSRQEVPELEGTGPLVVHHALDKLSAAAGGDLLVSLGVTGRQRDLEASVRELDGHALSVTLLGTFLAEVCGGDIKRRDRFRFGDIILSPEEQLSVDATLIPAKRAAKVMAGYLDQFDKLAKSAAGLGGPERALLHLLGLVDRPADGPAIDMLLAERIPGLTDGLFVEPVEKRWLLGIGKRIELRDVTPVERAARLREAKSRLRKLRLLAKEEPSDKHGLDAHPMVRAYFAKRLEQSAPQAAQAAHERLFRHYAMAAPDLPNTLEEMQPLFHAIGHGVRAGLAQEAFEILQRRIRRRNSFYIANTLGAFGAELAAAAELFERAWAVPRRALAPEARSQLLNLAARDLTALGRFRESVEPSQAQLAFHVDNEDWRLAASAAGNFGSTLLSLGEVERAIPMAEQAVVLADRSNDFNQRWLRRAELARAFAAQDRLDEALQRFKESEKIRSGSALLMSYAGYHYGDLLLARGEPEAARDRGRNQLAHPPDGLEVGTTGAHVLGLGWLLMGRAQDALGQIGDAAASLDAAVEALRKAGQEQLVPQALLARAAYRRKRVAAGETALLAELRDDLAEVEDIADPEMRLYLTDLALERARLALDVPASVRGPEDEAAHQTKIAADLIAATGYHRRDGELRELQARLAARPRAA